MFELIFGLGLIIFVFIYPIIVFRKELLFLIKNIILKIFGELNF